VINLQKEDTQALATMCERGMKLSFTIQEGDVMIANDVTNITITPQILK